LGKTVFLKGVLRQEFKFTRNNNTVHRRWFNEWGRGIFNSQEVLLRKFTLIYIDLMLNFIMTTVLKV